MPSPWSRRTFLAGSGAAAVAAGLSHASPAAAAPAATSDDAPTAAATTAEAADAFDTLRLRWRALTLGTGFDAAAEPYATKLATLGAAARTSLASMAPATGSLWPDQPLSSTASITGSYARLNEMAQAWAQPATGSTADPALIAAVVQGLDHLYGQVYNENTTPFLPNWWDWQIGSPRLLLDTVTVAYDALSAAQTASYLRAVDHFVPDSAVGSYTGTSTGANRVDLCRVIATRGVLGKSAAKLVLARDALSPVFPYVTAGDGLYADGSFVQHTYVAYTGSYGEVQIDGLARLFALLAGSTWAVTDPNRQIILDSVEKAYAPFLYNGLVMDAVSGRAISRGIATTDPTRIQGDDHRRGHPLLAHIALLAEGASATERTRWQGLVKGWIQRDYYSPVLADAKLGIADLARLQAIADSAVTAVPEPVAHRLFPGMDRAVHRRADWAASISMASKRITYYENGNGENLRGWHTGSGMLSWWGSTYGNGQYSDAFWPTVDPYRLPGTTVSKKALADGAGGAWGAARPDATWVGGATDGVFAAVGQHLKGLSSTMTARKSWFCLDDTVVCLGAGITSTDGTAVETVVENRNLGATGTHGLAVNGTTQSTALGWTATLAGTTWARITGFGGYVFPGGGGATVKAVREARTGTWAAINTGGTTDELTRRYLTLWLDHGVNPTNASYAYLVMPGATAAATAARAAATGWLVTLANTAAQQGVSVPSLGFTGINFWSAGTVGGVTASIPACVMIRVSGTTATICVSEPPRSGGSLDLTWNRPVSAVTAKDATVTVTGTGASLRLTIAPGTTGATHRATVTLA